MTSRASRPTLGIVTGATLAVAVTGAAIAVGDATPPDPTATLEHVSDQAELTAWVEENGLTGLSPASVHGAD